jgi:fructose-1-phosphate kinase PfkB-like protein
VFLAGLIHALFVRAGTLEEAVEFALPLAAANAASEGVATFDLHPFDL